MSQTVEIKNMSKHFGPTVALNHVSFEAYSGEVLGLIGENDRKIDCDFDLCGHAVL